MSSTLVTNSRSFDVHMRRVVVDGAYPELHSVYLSDRSGCERQEEAISVVRGSPLRIFVVELVYGHAP